MTAQDILRTMDYGVAPESDEHARAWLAAHSGGFGHFIAGAFTPPGAIVRRLQSGARRAHRPRQPGDGGRRRRRRSRRRARRCKSWSALSGDARARHLYALARHVQKRERLLAVLESLDNGKPIRESRDIDVPLVARHFYHHAGWASLIADEFPGHQAGRRLRPDHPVELPAADAGVEDRAGAGGGQHRRAEAGRVHAADRARLRRDLRRGRAAARRRQHRHRRRRDRRGAGRARRRRQDRLHRLDRGRPRDPPGDRRHGQEAVARARRQVAVRRLRGRRSRQRGRGRRRRDLVQPGPGVLRRLAAAGRRIDRRADVRQAARADGDAEGRRPARQVDRRRRDRRAGPARAHQAAGRGGRARGREGLARAGTRCPSAAASIRRRWSPTSSRRRSWRARRSSGRCWRR